jgi:hypothetical protein
MDDRTLRDGVTDADATGMVAGEELITEAETLLPLLRPALPIDDLHKALPAEHGEHSTIDRLHAEVNAEQPDPSAIERHVGRLRALPELEAIVANWWDDPRVQRFVANLNQIGL